jgi:hypothetical protein
MSVGSNPIPKYPSLPYQFMASCIPLYHINPCNNSVVCVVSRIHFVFLLQCCVSLISISVHAILSIILHTHMVKFNSCNKVRSNQFMQQSSVSYCQLDHTLFLLQCNQGEMQSKPAVIQSHASSLTPRNGEYHK